MSKIRRALLSVFDKTGLVSFAQALTAAGIELISTGGTARTLRDHGLKVTELGDYTGFPEMLDGRVKTLHPKVHGGLLYIRGNPQHEATIQAHQILPIDLVVVNLYPFAQTVAKPEVSLQEAIENIDIGGPSMLRSAAKNHESVTVVMDPSDYALVAEEIQARGETTLELRRKLAARVFARTSAYDAAITAYLSKIANAQAVSVAHAAVGSEELLSAEDPLELPPSINLTTVRSQTLRYGENPHQKAALYGDFKRYYLQLHGKELSYNNILDLTAATHLIGEFGGDLPTLAILKHMNPCGLGQGATLREAWDKAFATDKQAPFGGIIAVNQILDQACAAAIVEIFSEVIVAPEFTPEALAILHTKKNLRLIKILQKPQTAGGWDLRSVGADSYLVQERDLKPLTNDDLKVVSKRQPTKDELQAMLFGWKVVKHIKSNAILYVASDRTLGVGAGQMSRVDASRLAIMKAAEAKLSLTGSVICSDAFFPFADGLVAAAEAGATAAIEPGGSVRDAEVIAAADARNMALVFTGMRHFRH